MVIPIAIDVEPGGSTRNIARIGVAEVEPDGLCFQLRFQSPFRGPGPGYVWPTGFTDEADSLPTFDEVWPWLDGYLADRPVVAYNAGYDRHQLRRLVEAIGAPVPPYMFHCAMAAARQILPAGPRYNRRPFDLVCVMASVVAPRPPSEEEARAAALPEVAPGLRAEFADMLISDIAEKQRSAAVHAAWEEWRAGCREAGIVDAQRDALMCAQVWLWAASQWELSPGDALARVRARRL